VVTVTVKTHFIWAGNLQSSVLEGDFRDAIWGPAHGLIHGLNPFISDQVYQTQYGTPTAALYTPDIYLAMAPAALVPFTAGAIIFFIAMLVSTWATVLVVIRPWSADRLIMGALFGALVMFSLPSEYGLAFGQPAALLAFGAALTIRAAVKGDTGVTAVIGVTIVLLKVQTGLPIVLVLLAMAMYRVVTRAVALTLVLSIPGLIAEVRAAHGILGVLRTWRTNLHFYTLNSTAMRMRVDLAGTGYRLSNYDITVLSFLFGIAISVIVVLVIRRLEPGLWMWPFISSFLTLALYHQQYDVLIPLLCFLPIMLEFHYDFRVWLTCFSILLVDLLCRPSFAAHWINLLNVTPATFIGALSTFTTFALLFMMCLLIVSVSVEQKYRNNRTPLHTGDGEPSSSSLTR
jgi:hypothetical protein